VTNICQINAIAEVPGIASDRIRFTINHDTFYCLHLKWICGSTGDKRSFKIFWSSSLCFSLKKWDSLVSYQRSVPPN